MAVTKHWVPFDLRLHSGLCSVFPLHEAGRCLVSMSVRDADGHVLEERPFNDGQTVTGVASLVLDFAAMFPVSMRAARVGVTEVVFTSDAPYHGSGCHYFVGPRGFTCFLNGPLASINQRNPKSRYRGFSAHFIDESVDGCGLVVMNVSTNPEHSRVASMDYDVCDERGTVVQSGHVDVPPFGTRWIGIDHGLVRSGAQAYTMFARSDGTAMISLIWTHLRGGGLGLDHTQPPPTQFMYGEDLTPGVMHRLRRLRTRLGRGLRYRFNRLDERPLLSFRSSRGSR
jgi:hypothetical protein